MLRVRPFAATTPIANVAARVSAPPYDVVDAEEARMIVWDNPLSFLRVTRAEVDLPRGTDVHSEAVYRKAKETYEQMIAEGTLLRADAESLFIYRQTRQGHRQISVVGCVHVDDYESGVIRKHEKTRADKEADRTRHIETVGAQTGPVFLAYRDHDELDALMRRDVNDRPLFHFVASDDVTHTVWRVRDPRPYVDAFANVPRAYIADGHHRAASAANVARTCAAAGRDRGEAAWFIAALFPASQLKILPYHRLVKSLNEMDHDDVIRRLREIGSVTDTLDGDADAHGVFCVYLDGIWRRVEIDPSLIPDPSNDPTAALDVSLVQRLVLEEIFGIGDPRTDPRLSFVGGIRGLAELERLVNEGAAAMAISMHATTMDQLLTVADAGLIMPPKSTWFEPKLRDGLLVHEIE
jgi:uncharacterized protein (DUF1015 family)